MFTEIYEDNAGFIHAIIRHGDNIINVITGLEQDDIPYNEFINAARWGFEDADEYDPDEYGGKSMEDVANEITSCFDPVAEITSDHIELHLSRMGLAAKRLFCIDVD